MRLFVLFSSLWATVECSHTIPLSHPPCDTESHCDKEVTPPLLAVSMFISYLFLLHLSSPPRPLACFSSASLSLFYTTVSALSCALTLPLGL